ncbi:hypothetical protein SK854_18090 [Lentzea sp. BCCO 10_0061]|uniref:Uncharacterized protein n=1 Tax=Lentzea sokolovensis TaxID=3095429 RepID=A0ABU4UZE4_9PSEU|nr:hypothetical protein [Lentzea sp. BCCO 10_0061]MDX8144035.1 hypothetical protein [Lentzea sp. BCCO 10_0061]
MNIEDELRGALDVSAPPPTTTLDHVLKRGRRRVFAQRAGATLGMFAVVAGIGIGATTLNHAAPDLTPADQPNTGAATVEHPLGWPRVDTPPQIPYRTWSPASSAPPPAGRAVVDIPLCDMKAPQQLRSVELGAREVDPETVAAWLDEARKVLPEVTIGAATPDPTHTSYEADVSDSRGTGSLRITLARFTGTPLENANDALWETGDCQPAQRHVFDNSVLQLHSVRPYEPFQTLVQVLRVYHKHNTLIQLELRNFGSPDMTPDPKQPGSLQRTGAGRATLPLTEEQFARLGPAVAAVA